jgi:xanthine dehydrogenase accessory factor
VTEAARPTLIHRRACFGAAIGDFEIEVENVPARRAADLEGVRQILKRGAVPVLIDPPARIREVLKPWVLVDATGLGRNVGTSLTDAPIVVGIGMGFKAGLDVHVVVESRETQDLGRAVFAGELESPREAPFTSDGTGIIKAARAGRFEARTEIGQMVSPGEVIGTVGDLAVQAPHAGLVAGILADGIFVGPGMRLADVDRRSDPALVSRIDPRARAVAGGVLEGILYTAAVGSPGQSLETH